MPDGQARWAEAPSARRPGGPPATSRAIRATTELPAPQRRPPRARAVEPALGAEWVLLPIPPRMPAHPRRPRVPLLGSSPATRGHRPPPRLRPSTSRRERSLRASPAPLRREALLPRRQPLASPPANPDRRRRRKAAQFPMDPPRRLLPDAVEPASPASDWPGPPKRVPHGQAAPPHLRWRLFRGLWGWDSQPGQAVWRGTAGRIPH